MARRLPAGPLALILFVAGLAVVGTGLGQLGFLPLPAAAGRPPPPSFPVLEPSRPVRIAIAAIGVRAPILGVGTADDGSIAVPPLARHREAGWFDRGPTPGQYGPSILVGHADTRSGPSVFHDIPTLKPGAAVEVTRQDGTIAVFEVTSVEHFDKDALPARRVYGDFSRPQLRLITCGGRWIGGGTGYRDNIVVFAALVRTRAA